MKNYLKVDKWGFGDFCDLMEHEFGKHRVFGSYESIEMSEAEFAFFEAEEARRELIQSLDEEILGYRKDEDKFRYQMDYAKRKLGKVDDMYQLYIGRCQRMGAKVYDFYNLITLMREHGWMYECQVLCEEMYFSCQEYFDHLIDEHLAFVREMGGDDEE